MQKQSNEIDRTEKSHWIAVLATEKVERRTEAMSLAENQIHAEAGTAKLLASRDQRATLQQRRVSAIALAKPDDVIQIDQALLSAGIALEIAEADAAKRSAACVASAARLRDADARVSRAACALLRCELLELAAEFTQAMDGALALGAKLRAMSHYNAMHTSMSAALPAIPLEVERALLRLPQPNPLHTPLHLLRSGGAVSDAWANRLAELIQDDEKPSDDLVAA